MYMEDNTIKNCFVGTNCENNNYYITIYDINKNNIQKELISDLRFSKEKLNNLNIINKNENINYKAFCFDCKKNIDLNKSPKCKTHNIKYLNDLINALDIKKIEDNLKSAIENYKKVYTIIEHKLNEFKKRNENQIILAQKIIDIYKSNIDNLNYQIASNTKNLLCFNQIKFKDFNGYNLKFILEANILKAYSIDNYINEKFIIKNIQKNLEIKSDNKLQIRDAVILNKQGKIIFNAGQTLFLLNNKNYSFEDKIEIKDDILSMNLLKEIEMILITFKNSIKKIKIAKNKIKIEDFLNDIEVSKPGIVIKYQDEFAWTHEKCIEFSDSQTFDSENGFKEDHFDDVEISYSLRVINLIQFYDDLLFIISLKSFKGNFNAYTLMLGSYKNVLTLNNYMRLEDFCFNNFTEDLDYYKNIEQNYDIHIFNYDEIIISGKLKIFIINPVNWEIKKSIILYDKLIENIFYLNDSIFLIFLKENLFQVKFFYEFQSKTSEKLKTINKESNVLIAKINGNIRRIIFESFINCEGKKIFFNYNNNSNSTERINLINKFISLQNNISVYEFIDVQKKLELKNN